MDIKNNNEEDNKQQQQEQPLDNETKSNTADESKPTKRIRRQATQEQLDNPLHGVKLAQVLERLVAHYGWEYLGDRTNIRCFLYYPTMKSSLGFLRKTDWAREFVEDIYLEMVERNKDPNGIKK